MVQAGSTGDVTMSPGIIADRDGSGTMVERWPGAGSGQPIYCGIAIGLQRGGDGSGYSPCR